jgi:hypothetical protein
MDKRERPFEMFYMQALKWMVGRVEINRVPGYIYGFSS